VASWRSSCRAACWPISAIYIRPSALRASLAVLATTAPSALRRLIFILRIGIATGLVVIEDVEQDLAHGVDAIGEAAKLAMQLPGWRSGRAP
jgi:class 3 adenylate cyclase